MTILISELLRELIKRSDLKRLVDLRSTDFLKQNEAIDDRSRLKAYNCTRRAGKSIAIAIDFAETCANEPNMNCLYMALTIGSAREILWDAAKEYALKADPYAKSHESRVEIRFSNGSKIKFSGADCSEKQMRKVLGQKYKKVAIDEAGSFTIDMHRLVYQMIRPATADYLGQIILLGTCENIRQTFFEKVTTGEEPGWSIHKWTAYDNPHMKDKWIIEVNELIERNPNVINASWFKTHYLNQWCADDELLVLHKVAEAQIDEIPIRKTPYVYILGVDLGFNDSSAFTVICYHDYDKICYVVESYKEPELIFSQVAQRINFLSTKFPFSKIIIDGANKQGVEEIKQRFSLALEPAQKTEKAIFLKLLNDDFVVGNVKIKKNSNNQLITEALQLQWEDSRKEKEDARCENHSIDALLYSWRSCYHFLSIREPIIKNRNSEDYMNQLEEDEANGKEKETWYRRN